MTGGDRVASRLRVAASACLVASGLFMCGAGGAIALADPGPGYGRSDDLTDDDSIGDIVRRAFGLGDGNDAKASEPAQGPHPRWGNGRQGQYPGEKEPPRTGTSPTEESPTKEPPTTKPTTPCPEPTKPTEPPGNPQPNLPQSTGRRRWRRDRAAAALHAAVDPGHAAARRTATGPARCGRRTRRARRRCGYRSRSTRRGRGAHRLAGDRGAAHRSRWNRRWRRAGWRVGGSSSCRSARRDGAAARRTHPAARECR